MVFFVLLFLFLSLDISAKEVWVFASAHATGAYETNWRTDLSILNNSNGNAEVKVYLLLSGVDKSSENLSRAPKILNINPKNQIRVDDILKEYFNVEQGSGALLFSSEGDIFVVSRTYNLLPDKEYGQFIPGVEGEKAKKEQRIIGAISSFLYRSNFGLLNPSKTDRAQINLKFLNQKGNLIKEEVLNLDPWVHIQFNDFFTYFNINPQEDVTIEVNSNLPIFAYLSTVDNKSSDPIFIPGLL